MGSTELKVREPEISVSLRPTLGPCPCRLLPTFLLPNPQ